MKTSLLAVAFAAWAPSALATTLLAQDLESLSRRADAVVQGRVKRLQSRWNGDRTRIFTEVELEVSEALKGAPGKTVTLIQPGGVVGEIGQRVSGLASFEPGEEVVVFLEKRSEASYHVAGMAQGKLRVERSSDGRAAFAVPEPAMEALLLDPHSRQPVQPQLKPIKLEELKAKVRALAGEQRPR